MVGCEPMKYNVTISDFQKGESNKHLATTTLSDEEVSNYCYTAVLAGVGDTDKQAKERLRNALENLIHAAQWRLDSIKQDLRG